MDGFFWRGCAIGFALAAPVGPVGMLCIRRALTRGRVQAAFTGLGAAIADTLFGVLGALGVSTVSLWLTEHRTLFAAFGAAILIVMGLVTLRADVHLERAREGGLGMVRDFATAFVLTMTNPATLVAALATVAAFVHLPDATPFSREMDVLIAGIFAGSAGWWLFLSGLAGTFRARVTDRTLTIMNHATGAVLLLFGIGTLVAAVTGRFALLGG